MASSLELILRSNASRSALVESTGLVLKKAGQLPDVFGAGSVGGYSQFSYQDQGAQQRRYSQYRGWVYSAIHALATEASKQPVLVGRMGNPKTPGSTKLYPSVLYPSAFGERDLPQMLRNKMPQGLRHKTADSELQVIANHSLVDLLERPNRIQYKMQFVYSFVANLCLTGWSYIIAGTSEETGELEFYSLPTSWVIPDHSKGAFQQFRIVNPKNAAAGANQPPLDRSQVAFAYLPNPSDPLSALAPAMAQNLAIQIDDHIQSSQAMFFENGLFPSAIVTIGKNPHPDVPGGIRPRLTPEQRRQVYAAIKKVSIGEANYGNPAIVDGMIESIERCSATQNEMGWEKSEKATRTRILSAFGVHPFILGEEMAGSYAQAFIVQDRFCQRVNLFLDMLSTIMTDFAPPLLDKSAAGKAPKPKTKGKLIVWWEEAKAVDQQREQQEWDSARGRDDVSQDEIRARMGLPPDEDRNQAVINKTSIAPIAAVAAQVKKGELTPEQGEMLLIGAGLPDDMAKKIAGPGPTEEEKAQAAAMANQMGQGGPQDPNAPADPNAPDPAADPGAEDPAPEDDNADYSSYFKSQQEYQQARLVFTSMDAVVKQAQGLLIQ